MAKARGNWILGSRGNKMKFYTGIGSRICPKDICEIMSACSRNLELKGLTLRSGGAEGADWAFQSGVEKAAQIWLPWKYFNQEYQNEKPLHNYRVVAADDKEANDSLSFHPNAANLKDSVKKMMVRNFRQVIGLNEPNSSYLICWTPGGEEIGGSAQALRIAGYYGIPIFNLGKKEDYERILRFVG